MLTDSLPLALDAIEDAACGGSNVDGDAAARVGGPESVVCAGEVGYLQAAVGIDELEVGAIDFDVLRRVVVAALVRRDPLPVGTEHAAFCAGRDECLVGFRVALEVAVEVGAAAAADGEVRVGDGGGPVVGEGGAACGVDSLGDVEGGVAGVADGAQGRHGVGPRREGVGPAGAVAGARGVLLEEDGAVRQRGEAGDEGGGGDESSCGHNPSLFCTVCEVLGALRGKPQIL